MQSPIKGAAALANGLIEFHSVTFVSLKNEPKFFALLNSKVQHLCLESSGLFIKRLFVLRQIIKDAGERDEVVTISFCLSADFFNSFCQDVALTISSVRGNLPRVYPNNYGFLGKWIAYTHLNRLRKMRKVISMTKSMANLVDFHINRPSYIIGNFIDEPPIKIYRRMTPNLGGFHFVYTGSLIHSKQPDLLLVAMDMLHNKGFDAKLDIIGDGPLLNDLKKKASKLKNPDTINFFGHVDNPFEQIARADAIVLPSLTEGVSRSALEALYLGVPCIMRDTDGNSELITSNVNGELFKEDNDIADAMLKTAMLSRSEDLYLKILIPDMFRQNLAIQKYRQLFNNAP